MALERYKVTMRSVWLATDGRTVTAEATDHIDIEHLDGFVEQMRAQWQYVEVGTEIDHGPGGEDGAYVPPVLNGE